MSKLYCWLNVIFAVIFLIALTAAFVIYSEKNALDQRLAELREQSTAYKEEHEMLLAQRDDTYDRYIGFIEDNKSSKAAIGEEINKAQDAVQNEMTDSEMPVDDIQGPVTLEDAGNYWANRLKSEAERARLGQINLSSKKEEKTAYTGKKTDGLSSLDMVKADIESALQDLKSEYIGAREERSEKIEGKKDQRDESAANNSETKEQFDDAIRKLNTQVIKLQVEIRRQMEEQEIIKTAVTLFPDGKVIGSDINLGLAFIDLGGPDRVLPGMKFLVFRYTANRGVMQKGYIEVKKPLDIMTECVVLSQMDDADPIMEGDYISNPFYDKAGVLNFFVADETFEKPYSADSAKAILREWGQIVQKEIGVGTQYLVLGNKGRDDLSAETQHEASNYGLEIMRFPAVLEEMNMKP